MCRSVPVAGPIRCSMDVLDVDRSVVTQVAGGRLVLAATPMGDVGDASQRLRDALSTADVVAAEDTRRTRSLAKALGVELSGRVVSFYDHVETARIPMLLDEIAGGRTVLLVTDAGMPSVSDPGYRMVAACVERDLAVTCLPGPSAVTTALALSRCRWNGSASTDSRRANPASAGSGCGP